MASIKISALTPLGSGSIANDNVIPIVSGSTYRTSIADLRAVFSGSGSVSFPYTGSAVITGSLTVSGSFNVMRRDNDLRLTNTTVTISGSAVPIAGAVVESGSYAYFAGIEKIPQIFDISASYVPVIGNINTSSNDIFGVAVLQDRAIMTYRNGTGGKSNSITITSESIEHRGVYSGNYLHTRFRNNNDATLLEIYNNGRFVSTHTITEQILGNVEQAELVSGSIIIPFAGSYRKKSDVITATGIGHDGTNNPGNPIAVLALSSGSVAASHTADYDDNTGVIRALITYKNSDIDFTEIIVDANGIEHRGFDTGSSVNTFFTNSSGSVTMYVYNNGNVILPRIATSFNFANDAAAASGSVPIGGLYHTSGSVKIRLA
jgi:hypothetical protein